MRSSVGSAKFSLLTFWQILAVAIAVSYLLGTHRDPFSGYFGIYWTDEGPYLYSAKNAALGFHYPNDRWQSELLAPLLNAIAYPSFRLLESLHASFVYFHWVIAAFVLAAVWNLAAVVARSGGPNFAVAAVFLLASPLYFFYARCGLSEGIQLFIFSLIVRLLILKEVRDAKRACAMGALIAVLLISKISAAGVAAALCLTVAIFERPRHTAMCAAACAAVIIVYAAFIWPEWQDWYRFNISGNAAPMLASPLGVVKKIYGLIYQYLFYMPYFFVAFVLFVWAAATRRCPWPLLVCALTTAALEALVDDSVRRNFFGLTMMTLVGCYALGRARYPAIVAVLLSAPIFAYQALWADHSLRDAYADLKSTIPRTATVGGDAIWYLLGLDRPMIYVNCIFLNETEYVTGANGPEAYEASDFLLITNGRSCPAPAKSFEFVRRYELPVRRHVGASLQPTLAFDLYRRRGPT